MTEPALDTTNRRLETTVTPTACRDGRFEVRTTSDSHFGWIRTRLSVERTMMSWLRTATALIGFGFAIVQFFERLQATPAVRRALLPNAPQYLGLALIGAGVLAVLVATLQYLWVVRYLWSGSFASIAGLSREQMAGERLHSPVIAIAVLLAAIGLFAFFAVLLRIA